MSKKEIDELVRNCELLGWGVRPTGKGFYQILPPGGGDPIITPGRTNGRSLSNLKADLERAGYNPDAVLAAKALKAEEAIKNDRAKNAAALARAAERAAEPILAPVEKAPTTAPAKASLTNPFVAPSILTAKPGAAAVGGDISELQALAGYPCVTTTISQADAAQIVAYAEEQLTKPDGCRQRKLYPSNIAKIQQGMEMGEWEHNPADSLVFCKEHRSIVNGRHRMAALANADPDFIEAFYPGGRLPFNVTTDFPCDRSYIFDTGKNRSGSDALTFYKQDGWSPLLVSALRLAMQYDQSFKPVEENPVTDWTKWRRIIITNNQLNVAATGLYKPLLDNTLVVSRAYNRSNITRSASMVAAYLFKRDNPDGNPKLGRTNEMFWKGVSDDDTVTVGDPRRALIRVTARTVAKNRADTGPVMLAYLLFAYAKYMSGKSAEQLGNIEQIKADPMLPVWTPAMRWDGRKLIPMKRASE